MFLLSQRALKKHWSKGVWTVARAIKAQSKTPGSIKFWEFSSPVSEPLSELRLG